MTIRGRRTYPPSVTPKANVAPMEINATRAATRRRYRSLAIPIYLLLSAAARCHSLYDLSNYFSFLSLDSKAFKIQLKNSSGCSCYSLGDLPYSVINHQSRMDDPGLSPGSPGTALRKLTTAPCGVRFLHSIPTQDSNDATSQMNLPRRAVETSIPPHQR